MNPLQITLIIILVLIVVTAILTYFVRNRYYEQINTLDQEKNEILKDAPYEELKEVASLNITGQSFELRESLEKQWKQIESVKYPQLENHLFDAEQATDRYRLPESKRSQDAAAQTMTEITEEIETLRSSLNELIEREQANLEKIDAIKERYHEIRKSLLAYSFSFGPASESLEKKLTVMENEFTEFTEYTVSGDHEEANKIVQKLSASIEETEEEMEVIPKLLEKTQDVYEEEIKDLKDGYEGMVEAGYLFPNDTILEDINQLVADVESIYDQIRVLELEEAHKACAVLEEEIDSLYKRMEFELEAEPDVAELLENTKRGLYFLQDEHRKYDLAVKRLEQSYILLHEEAKTLQRLTEEVGENRLDYEKVYDQLKENRIPFSVAKEELTTIFNRLDYLNKEYLKTEKYLENYRVEELEMKDDMLEMEQTMYGLKRRLENERLPGLPKNYLELFFSTTDRIEQLSQELARPKIHLIDIRKIHQMCLEDVEQLEEMTEDIIRQVELIERTSQRLYRYKDSHKGIIETIRYSESLFSKDYDYETALRLVREKLENIDPGAYKEVESAYENELKID